MPDFQDRTLSELGNPQNTFVINAGLKTGPIVFSYRFRYIGKQTNGTYESLYSVQGRPATNPYQYPREYQFYPVITYSDLRAEFDVNDKFNFYAGVDNAFDQLPPFGLSGAGGGSGIYPNVGRFIYAGVVAKY